MTKHTLKTEIEYFRESYKGNKDFEIRKNDRDYKKGDHVELLEWNKDKSAYTGYHLGGKITLVTDYAQKPGFVVFGVEFP